MSSQRVVQIGEVRFSEQPYGGGVLIEIGGHGQYRIDARLLVAKDQLPDFVLAVAAFLRVPLANVPVTPPASGGPNAG